MNSHPPLVVALRVSDPLGQTPPDRMAGYARASMMIVAEILEAGVAEGSTTAKLPDGRDLLISFVCPTFRPLATHALNAICPGPPECAMSLRRPCHEPGCELGVDQHPLEENPHAV